MVQWNSNRWKSLFFPIWGGQALSLLGSRLVQFSLVWWLARSTDSATILATAAMMAYIPMVFLSPFAGALVDRWNRRLVMILADSGIALATVALAVLFATGHARIPFVYGLLFIRAVGGAFHWPAMQASTTLMVPKLHLSRVAGLNQSLHGMALLVSPLLGALLIEILPLQGVLAIDVGTALLAILPLLFIRIPEPRRDPASKTVRPSVIKDMVEGLTFAIRWRGMLFLILGLAVMNFVVNPAFSLMPLYVTRVLDGEAIHFGTMQALFGIGFILGGLLLSIWGGFKRRILTALLAVAVMGVAIATMGLTPQGWMVLAGGALFITGLMEPIANGSFVATMQASVPENMQGRVFSLLGSATQAVVPLGLALAGPLCDRFGMRIWFLIGGIAYLAVAFGSMLSRSIMDLEAEGERLRSSEREQLPVTDSASEG
ncbi:MFS transporter [Candidatus Bipolaricaulota bacterium]